MKRNFSSTLCLIALLATTAGHTLAGSMTLSEELDAEYDFTGGATTLQGRRHVGSVDEHCADVKYVVSPQITRDLLLRFGAEWERFDFRTPLAATLPDTLQQVNAVLGCDYQIGDEWLTRLEVQPGIYGDFKDVNWRSFNVPLVLGAAYLKEADVQWFFGLRLDVRSQYPVLPAVGVRWKFADEWTLNLQFPRPRLEYDFDKQLQFYLGADIKAGTFIVNDHFGTDRGAPRLNHAALDYYEYRVGPGCAWKVLPTVTVEASGGYMLGRTWDFYEQHVHLTSRPAPYVQVACHAKF